MTTAPTGTRIACLQLAPVIGDLAGNTALVEAAVAAEVASGTDVIVLPELVTSGYVFDDQAEARSVSMRPGDPFFGRMSALLGDTTTVVVLGFCEDDGPVLRNSAALVDATGVRAVYRKTHLWDRETLVFEPGVDAPPVIETAHGVIGVAICYDLEFPEIPRMLALAGADLLAVPTNWPAGDHPAAERVAEVLSAQAAARTNGVVVACCDRSGVERGQDWNQATTIIDRFGWVLDEVGPRVDAGTGIARAQVVLAQARDKAISPHNDLLADRRADVYARPVPRY